MTMTFQFQNWADFWSMPGKSIDHGPFVWGAYAITFVALLALAQMNRNRRRDIVKQIKTAQLHEQQLEQE